ncbi:MAG TPA: trypsin-like peptidase domain-containing protein [Gemmatimonadales bacterium]|nr:trypsin-like peptidase domain-containing protein [Gemmatimonadales bacterium]
MSLATLLGPVAERLRRSVVQVRAGAAAGAGVIWGAGGMVVTNAHVAHAARLTVVGPDGTAVPGAVERLDPERDLALVRAAIDLPPVRTADPAELRPGALVFAVGHPLGVNDAISAGVFQAIGALPEGLLPARAVQRHPWVQADLHLEPGNSGGPLADALGRVVGISAMIANGLALAVPSTEVRAFLSEHPPLGVAVRPVFLPGDGGGGLRVDRVLAGSPADQAGVLPGDVIVAAAGAPLRSAAELARTVALLGRDNWLTLDLVRDGRWRRHQARIAGAPA